VKGNDAFTIVAVEYFTKWVEAKPITNITSATIKKFFWQNIICRYGFLQQITVDNAKYFDCDMFKDFCHQVEMKVVFAFIYHPQSHRVVERANALIFETIKTILEGEKKGKLAMVMPTTMCCHNMMVYRATNVTPLRLLFRVEAVLPKEIKHRSFSQQWRQHLVPMKPRINIWWNWTGSRPWPIYKSIKMKQDHGGTRSSK
jgi:hypothetical protein